MIFLDSSVLVRRYSARRGPGAAWPGGAPEEIAVSDLVRVEVPSAIRRRARDGSLEKPRAEVALRAFAADLPVFLRVPVDDRVLEGAAGIVERHPLRSLDAIQLSSALLLAADAPGPLRFGSTDGALVAAAKAEGLALLLDA